MGGYTAWMTAMTKPEVFAALIPVCGGMCWDAGKLKSIPIWAFHGALDTTVFVTESINMVNAVNNSGGNAKLTIYPILNRIAGKEHLKVMNFMIEC